MRLIDVETIPDAVRKGTLVELSSDYRTASTVRSCLPHSTRCAMSAAAFSQHLLSGPTGERQSRLESICAVLTGILAARDEAARSCVEFSFRATDGRPQGDPLKVEWFGPGRYWVVLLPYEQLRPVGTAVAPAAAATRPLAGGASVVSRRRLNLGRPKRESGD